MDDATVYELVHDAVAAALEAHLGGEHVELHKRMLGGRILFEDDQGREVRAVPVENLFKKVTAIREKLRVLEQKLNNHKGLDAMEKADLQDYITRCYGSLTTFNFLFADESQQFRGSGG